MKLAGRQANGYFAKPETNRSGLLIYGADAMRVALKRQQVIAALIGPEGEAEMRLTRIAAGELRKDPAMLNDAIKAQSFFPGPRVAFVEDAADGLTKIITAALEDWADGDAQIIVTANQLRASSSLRKLFEKHPNAYAAPIYDDPPSRDEIEAELRAAGLRDLPRDALEALGALARIIPPGDFRQTIEKIALYKLGDDSPLSPDEIDLCAPLSQEAGIDDVLNCVVADIFNLTVEKKPFIPVIEAPNKISPCVAEELFIKLAKYLFSFLLKLLENKAPSKPAKLVCGW